MYMELVKMLDEGDRGLHAYRKAASRARALAATTPELAAGYVLLAKMADDFVDFTDRMALSASDSTAAYDRFAARAQALTQAFAGTDLAPRLAALNALAVELAAQGGDD